MCDVNDVEQHVALFCLIVYLLVQLGVVRGRYGDEGLRQVARLVLTNDPVYFAVGGQLLDYWSDVRRYHYHVCVALQQLDHLFLAQCATAYDDARAASHVYESRVVSRQRAPPMCLFTLHELVYRIGRADFLTMAAAQVCRVLLRCLLNCCVSL